MLLLSSVSVVDVVGGVMQQPWSEKRWWKAQGGGAAKSQKTLWEPFRYYCWIILVHPEVGHGVDCWSFFSRGRNYGNLSHGWYRLEHVCDV